MLARSLMLLALVGSTSCKKVPNLGGIDLQKYLPTVSYDRMRVDGVDFEGFDASFDFVVENRYPIDLRLARYDAGLSLEGNDFLQLTADDGFAIGASSSGTVKIPARIRFDDVIALVGGLKGKDEVGFQLAGKLGIQTPAGPIDVPFDQAGAIPTLKVPRIEPVGVRVAELKPLQNKARLEIDLAVTNQAKNNAYGMNDFAYAIDLGGRRVIDGRLDDLTVAAGATETRTIPVQLNLLQLGATVVDAITQKKPVDVRLDAGLAVDTPLGAIPLNVDEVVNLRVR